MKIIYFNLLIVNILLYSTCQKPQPTKNSIDLAPVIELVLYDRGGLKNYEVHLPSVLKQRYSIEIPSSGLTAHIFMWGGETGGPFNRIFSFCRDSGAFFQRNFFYDGEYDMSRMTRKDCLLKGTEVPLGLQLTELCHELGPEVYLNKDKMKDLLNAVMVKLLRCPQISAASIDSLKISSAVTQYDPKSQKELIRSLEKTQHEMTENNNPYVLFFGGELTNGIWKATIRQRDHTGRNCIDLEYLNGKYAHTMWM